MIYLQVVVQFVELKVARDMENVNHAREFSFTASVLVLQMRMTTLL
jgi:hypothetical protein